MEVERTEDDELQQVERDHGDHQPEGGPRREEVGVALARVVEQVLARVTGQGRGKEGRRKG